MPPSHLRPLLRATPIFAKSAITTGSRPFLTLRPPFPIPSTPPQTLTASRILPYTSTQLYALISDIPAYTTFLPYCTGSRVTADSLPDLQGKTWPRRATLTVGWGDVSAEFESRVRCVPGRWVEAVSGEESAAAMTASDVEEMQEWFPKGYEPERGAGQVEEAMKESEVFRFLRARWTLRPFPFKPAPTEARDGPATGPGAENAIDPQAMTKAPAEEKTEVNLVVEYAFNNPLFSALSAAAGPKVAEIMMKAFVERAEAMIKKA